MQIVSQLSIEDFIAELRDEVSLIADKIVRWTWTRTPHETNLTVAVDCCATALRKGGDEDYLIEYLRQVGIDEPEINDEQGTRIARTEFQKLAEACDDLGLKLRQGKIEVF